MRKVAGPSSDEIYSHLGILEEGQRRLFLEISGLDRKLEAWVESQSRARGALRFWRSVAVLASFVAGWAMATLYPLRGH